MTGLFKDWQTKDWQTKADDGRSDPAACETFRSSQNATTKALAYEYLGHEIAIVNKSLAFRTVQRTSAPLK